MFSCLARHKRECDCHGALTGVFPDTDLERFYARHYQKIWLSAFIRILISSLLGGQNLQQATYYLAELGFIFDIFLIFHDFREINLPSDFLP